MTKSKSPKQRMNAEERRLSIIKSAIPIFAQKGFHGTTVKDIAQAAGISPGLLYQHFPGKKKIYLSLGKYCEAQLITLTNAFKEREPGARMLVEMVYCLVMIILSDIHGKTDDERAFERFFAYSILENTDFTRWVFLGYEHEFAPLWEKCMEVAKKNNDIKDNFRTENSMWLIHHLAMAINFLSLAGDKIFDYKGTYKELLAEVLQLALTATGLKDEVIARYYNPAQLKGLLKRIFKVKTSKE